MFCIYMFVVFCFLFFKQKTAYEMRISDWSSDVCSPILGAWTIPLTQDRTSIRTNKEHNCVLFGLIAPSTAASARRNCRACADCRAGLPKCPPTRRRSEEHTSELQSLMRISYAVFCLTKKNKQSYRKKS